MHKKQIKHILLVLGIITLLTACGNADTTGNTEQNHSESLETDTQSTEYMIDSMSEQPLDLTNYSFDYELQTDDQPYFFWSWATKSEYGYYYFQGSKLMFCDIQSKKEVPLCNKADCTHDSFDCNADFSGGDYNFATSSLQYYDGYLYIVGYDNDGYTGLIRIAPDGSSKEEYMKLYKADLSSPDGGVGQTHWAEPEFCLHRGYVYFIDEKESQPKIRRMKLGTTETEIVFETSGIYPKLYRMLGYGDFIFFQAGNFIDESCIEIEAGIYAYNISTKDVQLVKEDAVATYMIVNNVMYYECQDENENWQCKKFDLRTLEEKLLLDGYDGTMAVDHHYLYEINYDNSLLVYEHNGMFVCTVNKKLSNCYFGDGTYLLGQDYDSENEKYFGCILEVSDLADGQAAWIYLD